MKRTLRNAGRSSVYLMGLCAILSTAAAAAEHSGAVETTVGIEGVYYARVNHPGLEAKPVDDDAPIVLRIADVADDSNSTIYELRYIGTLPGRYDLRDYLLRADGEPVTGLDPMEVVVGQLLPADHNGQLSKLARPVTEPSWRYRLLLGIAGGFWLVPPVWLMIRRIARRQPKPEVVEKAEPTLADQLRPLVEAAVAGRLSSADQARLELLLIAHWRQLLDLSSCSAAEALRRMRRHRESGELLRHLEQWLHQPPGRSKVDVAAILRPYRACAAVDENGAYAEEVSG